MGWRLRSGRDSQHHDGRGHMFAGRFRRLIAEECEDPGPDEGVLPGCSWILRTGARLSLGMPISSDQENLDLLVRSGGWRLFLPDSGVVLSADRNLAVAQVVS